MENHKEYDIHRDGLICAIRIYTNDYGQQLADLIFAFGGRKTISWTSIEQINTYMPGINGFTLFYDEREKQPFEQWRA